MTAHSYLLMFSGATVYKTLYGFPKKYKILVIYKEHKGDAMKWIQLMLKGLESKDKKKKKKTKEGTEEQTESLIENGTTQDNENLDISMDFHVYHPSQSSSSSNS